MLAFYIDEPLSPIEEQVVIEQLKLHGETITALEFKRIPFVFPADASQFTNKEMIVKLQNHLNNAGAPIGKQSVFILPKDGFRWGMLLQMAFQAVTQYYPYVVQPWEMDENNKLQRREFIMVTDTNAFMNS